LLSLEQLWKAQRKLGLGVYRNKAMVFLGLASENHIRRLLEAL
jgi:hypothetical protein